MTKVKLCGLTRPCDVDCVNELNPDYIGFVFFPKSKRNVTKKQAKELKAKLNPNIKAVGVLVNAELDFVANLLDEGIIDVAQLHGSEDADYIAALRKRTDKPIFKAYTIKSAEDVSLANASTADLVLVDSGKGSGMTFSWELLKEMKRDYLLAGGLNLDNIQSALDTLHPYGLDVSSGIETDGLKDPEKMKKFVEIARA